ncbi:MAG: hypothetical protein DYG89_20235 [Caldilinea sp. CFX5]|nr:hypothetical protein [Caldilinea sp. CFX5]
MINTAMIDLLTEAQTLIQVTQQNCHNAGEIDLYPFLVNFEQLMHQIWEAAERISQPHALISSELLDVSRIYLAGEAQLCLEQLTPLAATVALLAKKTLTMQDAANADRYLLSQGIHTLFPVGDDFSSLYN